LVQPEVKPINNEKEIKRIEKEISELETKIEEMNKVLAELDYTNEENSKKTLDEYEQLKVLLDNKMEAWEKMLN